MQRVRSNTRLGTLIVTTVPVTALGVVVGMGVGAPLAGLRARGASRSAWGWARCSPPASR